MICLMFIYYYWGKVVFYYVVYLEVKVRDNEGRCMEGLGRNKRNV